MLIITGGDISDNTGAMIVTRYFASYIITAPSLCYLYKYIMHIRSSKFQTTNQNNSLHTTGGPEKGQGGSNQLVQS